MPAISRKKLVPLVLILLGCGDSGTDVPVLPPIETIQFTVLPYDLGEIFDILPLGLVGPPDHTFPSDHIYINHKGNFPIVVYAPAAGYITRIHGGVDDGVEIGSQVPNTPGSERHFYYLGHLLLDAGLNVGTRITAGQRLGTLPTFGNGLDLGIVDERVTQPFIRPERYGAKALHGAKPFDYMSTTLRGQLAPLVTRENADDGDGTFVYDVPQRLKGNWFHESLPYSRVAQADGASWTRHLSFVENARLAGDLIIGSGGSHVPLGKFWVDNGDTPFDSVGPASGRVIYRVSTNYQWVEQAAEPEYLFMVEVTDVETLRIESFPVGSNPTAFTSAAAVYRR